MPRPFTPTDYFIMKGIKVEHTTQNLSVMQPLATHRSFMENWHNEDSGSTMPIPSTTLSAKTPPTNIDQLPAELKCQVAGYLSSMNDLKSLSLVDRTWASLNLPFLWEKFYADHKLSPRRQLRALTDPGSNIIKFVKHTVFVRNSPVGDNDDDRDDDEEREVATNYLPLLLTLVPRGQIVRFSSCGSYDSFYCFFALLHGHAIQQLGITNRSWNTLAKEIGDATCLSHVTRLKIYSGGSGWCPTLFDLQEIQDRCPQLEDLGFIGDRQPTWDSPNIDFTQDPDDSLDMTIAAHVSNFFRKAANHDFDSLDVIEADEHELLEIHSLRFSNVLVSNFDCLVEKLNVRELCVLTLVNMPCLAAILNMLGAAFAHGNTCLHTFSATRIRDSSANESFTESLQSFLLSFQGLKRLHIEYEALERFGIGYIAHHGSTLQELLFVNGGIFRKQHEVSVNASDLDQLAKACPHLESLCLNLYEIDVDDTISHLPPPHSPHHKPTEFAEALFSLSKMKNLRNLRFTNPSNYRNVCNSFGRDCIYRAGFEDALTEGKQCREFQSRADEMMEYLSRHDSNVQMLVFAPYEPLPSLSDLTLPIPWPNYLFRRAFSLDKQGKEVVGAQPSQNWTVEFSNTAIFDDIGMHVRGGSGDFLDIKDECSYFFRE